MGEVFSLRALPTYKCARAVDNLLFDPVIIDVFFAFIAEESHNVYDFVLLLKALVRK
jgi:hypothetical protein